MGSLLSKPSTTSEATLPLFMDVLRTLRGFMMDDIWWRRAALVPDLEEECGDC